MRLDYQNIGRTWWDPYNVTSRDPSTCQPAGRPGGGRWSVTAWSKNLTNKLYNAEFSPGGFLGEPAAPLRRRCHLQVLMRESMREFDEKSITQAVIGRLSECDDPRFKRVMTSLITHLHDFVREVELTEPEWIAAIQFLTDVGKTCTEKRQEFILLSDTLGVSVLVITLNHPADRAAPNRRCWVPSIGRALPICRAAAILPRE